MWNWFGAVFGIVVLLGVGILYFFGTSGSEIDEAAAPEQPVTAEEAEAEPAEPPATVAPPAATYALQPLTSSGSPRRSTSW